MLTILVISGLFYWFQFRPSKIKHDCSWIAKHEDAVPERPAMTKEELLEKGMIQNCDILVDDPIDPNAIIPSMGTRRIQYCKRDTDPVVESYKKTIPAKPAKDWYEPSTDSQYKFCLRDNGL